MYKAPDGGWGWVVTFVAFMIGLILDGISFSFGILFKHLLVYFNESKSLTSWIISVFNGIYPGIGPVSSILVSAFGMRKVAIFGALLASASFFLCTFCPNVQLMIIVYGLLGGFGLGLLYLPAMVLVGHYFTKKRALASGIACCGSGVGGFVFAPLMEYLISVYSWKGAMWVVSAIVLNGVPLGALLRPLEVVEKEVALDEAREKKEDSKINCCGDISKMFDFDLLKSPTFLIYGLSCFFCMLGFYIPFYFIPDLAEEFGVTSQEGAWLISIIGILNTVTRVAAGWLADRSWADPTKINGVLLTLCGIATLFVPKYSNYGVMATYCAFFGICIAVFVSYRPIITSKLLGIEKLASSFGLVCMCQGLASLIGAPIAGALSDSAGDYNGAFYLAGAAIGMSGLICLPLNSVNRWERRQTSPTENAIFNRSIEISTKL
ncbi:monocarboxylate transporter 3-like [Mercenaria mercenaria]|uniref:monocarboxylate transporter 3-like n=1 Tax=Mercenaria mercenaria TaxID=6596 RepID=UPI001E1DFA98|nr:monocarboxylate transporter 3-like [Mercenaria mercenaria]